MLLLYYAPVVMYRGVFTVGVVLTTGSDDIISANALNDYSYVNASDGNPNNIWLARCVTGLGPSGNDDNNALGGLYFNGNRIPPAQCSDSSSSDVVRPRGADLSTFVGVMNTLQCGTFSINEEGVYTCMMMNSSM